MNAYTGSLPPLSVHQNPCNLCRRVSEGIMGFFVLSKELRRASEGIMGFFVLSKEWSLEFKSRVSENSRKSNPR